MSATTPQVLNTSRNLQKHTNPNPLHRWLLGRFHRKIELLLQEALAELPRSPEHTGRSPLVLDAGCGEGFVATYLAQRLPGLPLLGTDSRREAVAFAKTQNPPSTGWMVGDVSSLPLKDESVPVVLCVEVLEHLDDPWAVLEELRRVCSGALILSVPSQPFFALANLVRGKNLRTLGEDPEHVSHWTARTFLRLLNKRVKVTRVAYAFPWVIAVADPRKSVRV